MITRILDLSTAHVARKDVVLLGNLSFDKPPYLPLVIEKREGWFISVPGNIEEVEDNVPELKEAGFSEAFINLLRTARRMKCDWIILDPESDVDRNFPILQRGE